MQPSLPKLVLLCGLVVWASACTTQPSKSVPGDKDQGSLIDPAAQRAFEQGVSLLNAEEYQAASGVFLELTERYPQYAEPYVNLAVAYQHLDRTSEAETALRRALEAKPDLAQAHTELAIIYRRSGQFAEAREHYSIALKSEPNYAPAHLNMGILCDLYLQELECALTHYERYQELVSQEDEQVSRWIVDLQKRL